jgi:hypothetical protein
MTPEQAAAHILRASGSCLGNYTPKAKAEIIRAAEHVFMSWAGATQFGTPSDPLDKAATMQEPRS